MTNENTFHYTYNAPEHAEVLNIRKKYLPPEESKLEELMRLDRLVQSAGTTASLCIGIGGTLVFGLGLCLAMKVIGDVRWLGILLGLVGTCILLTAYPIYRRLFNKAKAQHAPRILELSAELTGEN